MRKCLGCGKEKKHYAKGLCRACYEREYRYANEKYCPDCGKEISRNALRCTSCAKRGNRNPAWGKRGKDSPNWKGGRRKDRRGYVLIYLPNHPCANSNGIVMEHRLVVERALGRYLESSEHVHHINGVKDDNRLENLRLVNHHKETICPRCHWPIGNLQEHLDYKPKRREFP